MNINPVPFLLNLLLPVSCGVCGKSLNFKEMYICKDCTTDLEIVHSSGCRYCGKPVEGPKFCQRCSGNTSQIDNIYTACYYIGNVKKLIINFKYRNKRYLQKILGDFLVDLYKMKIRDTINSVPNLVVAVPLFSSRKRERGFNQSEQLAKYLSKRISVRLKKNALQRVKNTRSQSLLRRIERFKNMEGAFIARETINNVPYVLLIDDVATTGATLQNAAAALRKAGVKKITALIVAHGK